MYNNHKAQKFELLGNRLRIALYHLSSLGEFMYIYALAMLTILCCIFLKQRAEAEDNKRKEKKKEKNESVQKLKTTIVVSGVIVALIGAIFALTKKMREK